MASVSERAEGPTVVVADIDWIVCRGETRDVVDGVVACPIQGPMHVAVCAECRHLEAVQAEWRRLECRTTER
jgi:hypothetical protein